MRAEARVEFREMNAESLGFTDGSFDAVVCQLGLMLFARPLEALKEMVRVAKPGGRVCCLVQGTAERMLFTSLLMRIMVKHAPQIKVPGAPTLYDFGPPGLLEAALEEAGLADILSRRLDGAFHFPSPEDYWKRMTEGAGRTGAILRDLSAETRAAVERETLSALEDFRSGDGLDVPYEFVMARGRKP